MKEKIRAYSKCEFHTVVHPKILFSCEELTGEIIEEQSMTGSFTIQSGNEVPITGNVEAFDHRIELLKGDFVNTSFTVTFQVLAKGMHAGEQIRGAFHILTNGGEYDLPYTYQVVERTLDSRYGKIANLKEFTELAQKDYEEAMRLFSDPLFIPILCHGPLEDSYLRIYKSLRKGASLAQAMDEFLISVEEKERVTLTPLKETVPVQYDKEDVSKEITIKKEGWGYITGQFSCPDSCIFLAKKELTKEDFMGDEAVLPIVVSLDKLPFETTTVTIHFANVYQEFDIELSISPKKNSSKKASVDVMFSPRQLKKTYQKQLMQDYLDYRVGKITLQEYTNRSIECCNELMKFEEKNHWYRFIRLHMFIMKKDAVRIEQELETIEHYQEKMLTDTVSQCYYSYLLSLYKKDRYIISEALRQIRDAYEENPEQYLLFFMIMYLDEDYVEDKERIYEDLAQVFSLGCISPMLYYEVCELYNEYPNMIRQITSFELTVLYWGFRKNYLNAGVRARFIDVIEDYRRYDEKVYKILDFLYQQQPDEKLLQVICRVLMQGHKIGNQYHHYYALGVERSFKLLGLMEYYMKSMDYLNYSVLPQQVVLYFATEDHRLNEQQLAYLYANVVVNRQVYESSYEDYKEPIRKFLAGQVEKGNMSENLIVLYREFLKDPALLASVGKFLPNILFKQKLECTNPNMELVLVDYDESNQTQQVVLHNGIAYVDQITDHVNITLVDRDRRRYIGSIPFTLYPIIEDENFLPVCYEADSNSFVVLLRLAYYAQQADEVDYEIIKVYKALLEYEQISKEYRCKLNAAILQYYYEQYEGDILEEYLSEIDLELLDEENRNRAVTYMIDRELYAMAMDAVNRFGYYGLSMESVSELCTAFVEEEAAEYDDLLVTMAYELFYAEQYNEPVLKYLIQYAKGGNRELTAIYKVATRLKFDTKDLEERIVKQALLSDRYNADVIQAFIGYCKKSPNRFVMEAFLNVMAYRYFILGEKVSKTMPELWATAYRMGNLTYPLTQAAMLYAFSKELTLVEEYRDVLDEVMNGFAKQDMLFPFMKDFEGVLPLPKEMYIKSFLTYRSKAGHHVNVHYYRKGRQRPDTHTERMREYFSGYYVKDFVLFADEELQFYITDEEDGQTKRVEGDNLKLEKCLKGAADSRFAMINQLLTCREEKSSDEFEEMLLLYMKDVYLIERSMTKQ